MTLLTIVFGERDDLFELARSGPLWAEDMPTNRRQIEALWGSGSQATLFQTKSVEEVVADADLHEPDWKELRVLRSGA